MRAPICDDPATQPVQHPLVGVIADDVTGASDVASGLARAGVTTIQLIGVPEADRTVEHAVAVVIALRTRTAPVASAVTESLAALRWLRAAGVERVLLKVCSTFDSTPDGNIGPVADACLIALGQTHAVVCPANPENGRTVYQGHLFVGDTLLSESSMRHHPLTPMLDADLRRVLGAQTDGRVALVDHATVARGSTATRHALAERGSRGARYTVVDATGDADLATVARATWDRPFLVVAAGLAIALVPAWRSHGVLPDADPLPIAVPMHGRAAVLAGSCSASTRGQVAAAAGWLPTWMLDPLALARDELGCETAVLDWAAALPASAPLLIASSADPDQVDMVQGVLGREAAGALVERAFGNLARALVARGVRRLVVAGGETAGSVLAALGVRGVRIGPAIEPGVPWTETLDEPHLALVLKSGNFGSPDFFRHALGTA